MNEAKRNSLGFTVVEAFLIAIVLALIGIIGYKVYSTKIATDEAAYDTTAVSNQTTIPTASNVPVVNSSQDLDEAEKALDQSDSTASDDSDLSQLESQLGSF